MPAIRAREGSSKIAATDVKVKKDTKKDVALNEKTKTKPTKKA